jgi:hypothetical protein
MVVHMATESITLLSGHGCPHRSVIPLICTSGHDRERKQQDEKLGSAVGGLTKALAIHLSGEIVADHPEFICP